MDEPEKTVNELRLEAVQLKLRNPKIREVDFRWRDNIAFMSKDGVIGMVADYFEALMDGCSQPVAFTGGHPLGEDRKDAIKMEATFIGWMEHFDFVTAARIIYRPLTLAAKRIADFDRIALLEQAALTLQNRRSAVYFPEIVQNKGGKYEIPTRRISIQSAGCKWEAEIQVVVTKEQT